MWTLSTPMRLDTFWIHISGLMPFRLLLLLDFLCYAHSNVRTSATYKSKQQQQQKQQKQQQHSPRKSRFPSIACTHEEIVRNDRSGARAARHASQRIARSTLQAVAMHMHMMCRVELSLLPTRTKRNLPCSDWQMQLYCHRSFKYSSLIWDHFSLLENAIQVPPRDRGFLLPRKSGPPTFLHCLLPRAVARVRAANYRCLCCSHPRTAPSVWKGEKLASQQAPVFACEAYEHAAILFLLFFSRFLSGMFCTNQSHSALTIQHSSADDLLLYFVSPLEFLQSISNESKKFVHELDSRMQIFKLGDFLSLSLNWQNFFHSISAQSKESKPCTWRWGPECTFSSLSNSWSCRISLFISHKAIAKIKVRC